MRTEIDPTLTQLSSDLSQDLVTIHYWETTWKRGEIMVGSAYDGGCAHLVLTTSGDLAEIFVEVRNEEYDDFGESHTRTARIPIVDVFDVVVDSFGDDRDYSEPPASYARWLRSRTGEFRRLNLA